MNSGRRLCLQTTTRIHTVLDFLFYKVVVCAPDGKQKENEDGEEHLHVGERREANGAHRAELHDLQDCEEVEFALRDAANVAVGWIGRLQRQRTRYQQPMRGLFIIPETLSVPAQ